MDRAPNNISAYLIIPLIPLSAFAAYLSGTGLQLLWISYSGEAPEFPFPYAMSFALHFGWILCACSGRAVFFVGVCWLTSLYLCMEGIESLKNGEHAFFPALIIEIIPLLLAKSFADPISLPERLARWRRKRADISIQLMMGEGISRWFPSCLRQFLTGTPATAGGSSFRRVLAEIADAEHSLKIRMAGLAIPEQLRQTILTSASAIRAQAEKSAANLSIELERQALNAAAICRDHCEEIPGLRPQEKDTLSRQCEELLLGLIRPGMQYAEANSKSSYMRQSYEQTRK